MATGGTSRLADRVSTKSSRLANPLRRRTSLRQRRLGSAGGVMDGLLRDQRMPLVATDLSTGELTKVHYRELYATLTPRHPLCGHAVSDPQYRRAEANARGSPRCSSSERGLTRNARG